MTFDIRCYFLSAPDKDLYPRSRFSPQEVLYGLKENRLSLYPQLYPWDQNANATGGEYLQRGNQLISPDVIRRVKRENIHVIRTPEKIQALNGQALWVDTGDTTVDELVSGYFAVVTGYKQSVMYKVTA